MEAAFAVAYCRTTKLLVICPHRGYAVAQCCEWAALKQGSNPSRRLISHPMFLVRILNERKKEGKPHRRQKSLPALCQTTRANAISSRATQGARSKSWCGVRAQSVGHTGVAHLKLRAKTENCWILYAGNFLLGGVSHR